MTCPSICRHASTVQSSWACSVSTRPAEAPLCIALLHLFQEVVARPARAVAGSLLLLADITILSQDWKTSCFSSDCPSLRRRPPFPGMR